MKKDHVALVKRACRICHEAEDAEILLATRYNHNGEPIQDLKPLHGQVVGFLDGPCAKCKERLKTDEYYVLIEVDESKSEDKNNPMCTGKTIQIKKTSGFGEHLNNQGLFKHGLSYVPVEVAKEIEKLNEDLHGPRDSGIDVPAGI